MNAMRQRKGPSLPLLLPLVLALGSLLLPGTGVAARELHAEQPMVIAGCWASVAVVHVSSMTICPKSLAPTHRALARTML